MNNNHRATSLREMLNKVYQHFEGSEALQAFDARHGIASQAVLTVIDDHTASRVSNYLVPRIEGKTVVEIGGGIGLLAFHLGLYAKRVFVIEANPYWAGAFMACLLAGKPKNVSYLFGAADEFAGLIKADVALFCAHSEVDSLRDAGRLFAPEVIDVYGEIIDQAPAKFDPIASDMRRHA